MAELTNFKESLKKVIRSAKFEDNLAKGLHESCKTLENKETPVLCLLAKDCADKKYKDVIIGLAKQNNVPLVEVDSKVELGEWCGLCKYDADENPRKVRGCSSVVIKKYAESEESDKNIIEQYIKA